MTSELWLEKPKPCSHKSMVPHRIGLNGWCGGGTVDRVRLNPDKVVWPYQEGAAWLPLPITVQDVIDALEEE